MIVVLQIFTIIVMINACVMCISGMFVSFI